MGLDLAHRQTLESIGTTSSCSMRVSSLKITRSLSPWIWLTSAEESTGPSPKKVKLGPSADSWLGLKWVCQSRATSIKLNGTLKWTDSGVHSTNTTNKITRKMVELVQSLNRSIATLWKLFCFVAMCAGVDSLSVANCRCLGKQLFLFLSVNVTGKIVLRCT